jgi:hypothetical protein
LNEWNGTTGILFYSLAVSEEYQRKEREREQAKGRGNPRSRKQEGGNVCFSM